MKTLRFVCILQIFLLTGQMLSGATLVSLVDARRQGGTSVGSFVDNELPAFLLAPVSSTFGIRNTGVHPAGQWEFAVGSGGFAVVRSSATINLNEITSFSSAPTAIDASGIGFSEDRFNPVESGFLFAKVGDDYHAFRVALWTNNNNANLNGDRLRFYETLPASVAEGASELNVIPEPSVVLLGSFGLISLLSLRRRQA